MSTLGSHADKTTATTGKAELTKDEIYSLLSVQRRRDVLTHVLGSGEITKTELTEVLTELEYGEHYDSEQRKRVLVSLHQVHLPKLADMDVIEYENERVVRPGPNAHLVQKYRHDSRPGVLERVKQAL